MKIVATFDGSAFAESILPQLQFISTIPDAEMFLLRVAEVPHGRPAGDAQLPVAAATAPSAGSSIVVQAQVAGQAETKEQAVERVKAELTDYLTHIAGQLPAGVTCKTETVLDHDVKGAIIRFAKQVEADLIVMATHGRSGLPHVLHGSVAEGVLRAGVAPVLLVRPPDTTGDAG